MNQARPAIKAAPPPPKRSKAPTGGLAAEMASPPKPQDEFRAEGVRFAAELGWDDSGEAQPDWQIGGVRIDDAQGYLTRVAHEVHVATHRPKRCRMPEASDVVRHLGLDKPDTPHGQDEIAKVSTWLDGLKAAEKP